MKWKPLWRSHVFIIIGWLNFWPRRVTLLDTFLSKQPCELKVEKNHLSGILPVVWNDPFSCSPLKLSLCFRMDKYMRRYRSNITASDVLASWRLEERKYLSKTWKFYPFGQMERNLRWFVKGKLGRRRRASDASYLDALVSIPPPPWPRLKTEFPQE